MRIIFLDASIETARQHWAEIQGFGFLEECLRSAKVLFVDIWDEEARYMVDFEPTVMVIDDSDKPGQLRRCDELVDAFCLANSVPPIIITNGHGHRGRSLLGNGHKVMGWGSRSSQWLYQALAEAIPTIRHPQRMPPSPGTSRSSRKKGPVRKLQILFLTRGTENAVAQWQGAKDFMSGYGFFAWEYEIDVRFACLYDGPEQIRARLVGFIPHLIVVDEDAAETEQILAVLIGRRSRAFVIGSGVFAQERSLNNRPLDAHVGLGDFQGLAEAITQGLARFPELQPVAPVAADATAVELDGSSKERPKEKEEEEGEFLF